MSCSQNFSEKIDHTLPRNYLLLGDLYGSLLLKEKWRFAFSPGQQLLAVVIFFKSICWRGARPIAALLPRFIELFRKLLLLILLSALSQEKKKKLANPGGKRDRSTHKSHLVKYSLITCFWRQYWMGPWMQCRMSVPVWTSPKWSWMSNSAK